MRAFFAVLFVFSLAACDYGFEKQSHVGKLRVLAVQAEPAEIVVEPGGGVPSVQLTALAIEPSGAAIEIDYALCGEGGLPAANLRCPGDHGLPLDRTGLISARLDLGAFAAEALAEAVRAGQTSVPLAIGFDARAAGQTLHGFAVVNVRTSAGRPANQNPALEGLQADGVSIAADRTTTVRAGAKIRLLPVPSASAAEDTAEGRERLTFSFFATDGELDALRSTDVSADGRPTDPSVEWTAPAEAGPVRLWLVARDNRGGTGWLARTVQVVP